VQRRPKNPCRSPASAGPRSLEIASSVRSSNPRVRPTAGRPGVVRPAIPL
jgi:hypothetical protein